ncbi:hypothetical protein [Arthrobacter sp. CJ23]|nr:hypothetical protein [Arthrobacter sp. CJ23]UVJ38038.1 hypothetical protein NVV90_12280 [Arthrobacter sp. CJ23]
MANAEDYEKAVEKAEAFGLKSLTKEQKELVIKAAKQAGPLGRRAMAVFD